MGFRGSLQTRWVVGVNILEPGLSEEGESDLSGLCGGGSGGGAGGGGGGGGIKVLGQATLDPRTSGRREDMFSPRKHDHGSGMFVQRPTAGSGSSATARNRH